MKIEYITSNQKKFEEAQHVLIGWELERVNIDLTEIQGDRQDVTTAKAKEAFRILNRPLIVEDVSLCCPAIAGLPGPYIKAFLTKLGDEGFCDLIHRYEDHSVEAICSVGYIAKGIEPLIFEGSIKGKIVHPKGNTRHGKVSWNTIFLPDGHSKTFGEMTIEEHATVSMRFIALNKLRDYFEKKVGHAP